ncbi:MAG: amn [Gammaproteobacteria bacterium]|jgi:AMP nucleosidase|nr:amn [Gammaproteobacteria bacterium]
MPKKPSPETLGQNSNSEALGLTRETVDPAQITRRRIALDTLARYANSEVEAFQHFILLTNFPQYTDVFANYAKAEPILGPVLKVVHSPEHDISIIDYRVGSPMAALLMDVLSHLHPQGIIMLGLCGGIHRRQRVGDFLIPIAAIRDEGTSRHYMPLQVPSLPSFMIQKYIAEELIERNLTFMTGVVHSTDYRMWEFDEKFKARLVEEKATAVDMECSALFTTGFARKVPVGALLLVSDLPMNPEGIKTKASAAEVFERYTKLHLESAIAVIKRINAADKNSRRLNLRRFSF